jgi:ketosteroid isomerase-like protein
VTSNATRAALLARALRAAIETDAATVEQLFTDDVQVWTPAYAAASRAELVSFLERRDDAFSDWELDTTPLDVGGAYACAEWTVSMTHSGPLALHEGEPLAPTELRVTLHGVAVAEFEDDRICALRQYWDEVALIEQLGLVPGAS